MDDFRSLRLVVDTLTLPNDWNYGLEQQVVMQNRWSLEPPSGWGWLGLAIGIGGFFVPGGRVISSALLMTLSGLAIGVADMVKIETIFTSVTYMPPDPRYPDMRPLGTPTPPISFTP